jgi:hypothetical protein
MDRRSFFLGVSAAVTASAARAAQMQLGPVTPMGVPMRSYVQHPKVVKQNCPLWCWAASASMIFAANGFQVAQQRIVERTFGVLACAPSGNTVNIVNVLRSPWKDDSGTSFQPNIVAAYDPANGVSVINNAIIVNELNNDRPLLYCNTHHAMVVVAADYFDTPMGPNIQAVGVLDPYPGIPDFHPLSKPEIFPNLMGGQMTFLAAVQV